MKVITASVIVVLNVMPSPIQFFQKSHLPCVPRDGVGNFATFIWYGIVINTTYRRIAGTDGKVNACRFPVEAGGRLNAGLSSAMAASLRVTGGSESPLSTRNKI